MTAPTLLTLEYGMIRYCSISLTLVLSVVSLPSPSQTSPSGNVVNTERVALPSFAELAAGPRSPTEAESCCSSADMKVYERARNDTRFEMLKVTYRSDGL